MGVTSRVGIGYISTFILLFKIYSIKQSMVKRKYYARSKLLYTLCKVKVIVWIIKVKVIVSIMQGLKLLYALCKVEVIYL